MCISVTSRERVGQNDLRTGLTEAQDRGELQPRRQESLDSLEERGCSEREKPVSASCHELSFVSNSEFQVGWGLVGSERGAPRTFKRTTAGRCLSEGVLEGV